MEYEASQKNRWKTFANGLSLLPILLVLYRFRSKNFNTYVDLITRQVVWGNFFHYYLLILLNSGHQLLSGMRMEYLKLGSTFNSQHFFVCCCMQICVNWALYWGSASRYFEILPLHYSKKVSCFVYLLSIYLLSWIVFRNI